MRAVRKFQVLQGRLTASSQVLSTFQLVASCGQFAHGVFPSLFQGSLVEILRDPSGWDEVLC